MFTGYFQPCLKICTKKILVPRLKMNHFFYSFLLSWQTGISFQNKIVKNSLPLISFVSFYNFVISISSAGTHLLEETQQRSLTEVLCCFHNSEEAFIVVAASIILPKLTINWPQPQPDLRRRPRVTFEHFWYFLGVDWESSNDELKIGNSKAKIITHLFWKKRLRSSQIWAENADA